MTGFVNDHNYTADEQWIAALRRDYPGLFRIYPECSSGWDKPLRAFFDVVQSALSDIGLINISQIKEKFGGLRIYYWLSDGVGDDVRERISDAYKEAEARCWETCEITGEPGALIVRSHVWMVRAPKLFQPGDEIQTENVNEVIAQSVAAFIKANAKTENAG
jgi:hypothetical protein